MSANALHKLTRHPHISLAGYRPPRDGLATGYDSLDEALPGGGWPQGALTELLVQRPGHGETSLLLPALASLSRAGDRIALVGPPWVPCPQAWQRAGIQPSSLLLVRPDDPAGELWALQQLLASGAWRAVLGWPRRLTSGQLRKLQLAAESGRCHGFLIRPASAVRQHSNAALRLALQRQGQQLRLELVKCRGRLHRTRLNLELD